jgi:sec-independent protein translocase protein TatA
MGNFGWTEILLIAFVVLLLFGGKKIPELMRGLGRGVREFNDAKSNVRKEIEDSVVDKEPDTRKTSSTTTTQP